MLVLIGPIREVSPLQNTNGEACEACVRIVRNGWWKSVPVRAQVQELQGDRRLRPYE